MLAVQPYVLVLPLLIPADARDRHTEAIESTRGVLSPFAWTLSSSSESPFENDATPTGGLMTVYLWLCQAGLGIPPCVNGLLTAQFGLSPSPGGPIIVATNPVNGFSNSGTATCLELTAPDCSFFTVAAEIEILALPGNICFVPCDNAEPPEPVMGGEGCGEPGFHSMNGMGLNLGGGFCGEPGCNIIVDSPGACCLPNGSCVDVVNDCECLSLGGQHQGGFTQCTEVECRVVGVGSGTWSLSWGRTKARYGSR